MTKQEFLAAAMDAARKASASSGFPAGITVAQAALESAWGNSKLSREANNFFGIKAHGKHAWVEMPTVECSGGSETATKAKFARYASMEQCFECRDRLIASGALYAETRAAAGDPEKFARALAKRWATDPQYAEKLLAVYRANGLSELDSKHGRTRASVPTQTTVARLRPCFCFGGEDELRIEAVARDRVCPGGGSWN